MIVILMEESRTAISWLKRLRMRPTGVVSKKVMGALTILSRSRLWKSDAADTVAMAMEKVCAITASAEMWN